MNIRTESPPRCIIGLDGAAAFSTTTMLDDGAHADGLANDGFFGAVLPARPNNTIVEFYIEARDLEETSAPGPLQCSLRQLNRRTCSTRSAMLSTPASSPSICC